MCSQGVCESMRRILVSAYACEPDKGSEQGVGWHWVLEMAKTEELWVITAATTGKGSRMHFRLRSRNAYISSITICRKR